MNFEQNYFQLFGLETNFDLDRTNLSDRYRQLQKEVHPDRFAHQSDREQRMAMQYTAHINEAFDTLKSPLKRAAHLLKLKGRAIEPETSFRMDPLFLMQQMELRESLEEATSIDDLEALEDETETLWKACLNDFRQAISAEQPEQLEFAEGCVRKLQFLDKLRREIEQTEDQLTDN